MSLQDIVRGAIERVDSWLNLATGIGTNHGRSRMQFIRTARLSPIELEDLFVGEAIAKRICNGLPNEALRRGVSVSTGDVSVDSAVLRKLTDLQIVAKVCDAWTWARCYGGGLVWIGADDGMDPATPLQWSRIQSIRFATVLTRRQVIPHRWFTDPLSPTFGEVSQYMITRNSSGGGIQNAIVHASRMVRFEGTLTPPERKLENQGWSESELESVIDKLTQFNAAFASMSTMLQDASQGVFGIDGLYAMIASDSNDLLKQRLQTMELMRSVGRAIIIDSEKESFTRTENTTLAGLPAIIQQYMTLVAGAAEMPATVLFGMSPAGLNATGDSDMRNWYDRTGSAQQNVAKPRFETIIKMIMLAKDGPTAGVEPATWEVKFPSLWKPTPSEEAALRKTTADTDAIYIDKGVVTPEEIGTSRFRPEGWSAETSIEHSLRESAMASDAAAAAASQPSAPNVPTAILDDAQIAAAKGIVEDVAARVIPRETGIALMRVSTPLGGEACEAVMGETGRTFFTAPAPEQAAAMTSLQSDHASLQKSHASLKSMLKRVLARNRAGELVVGSPVGGGSGGSVSDEEIDALANELEPEDTTATAEQSTEGTAP